MKIQPIQQKLTSLLLLILLAVLGCLGAWFVFSPPPLPPLPQEQLIQSSAKLVLQRAGQFQRFTILLEHSTLLDNTQYPITIYAPTDDAMNSLSKSDWKKISQSSKKCDLFLAAHMEPRLVQSNEITKSKARTLLNNKTIPVQQLNGVIKIGQATLLKTDILCAQGIIHPINQPLFPFEEAMTD